MLRVIFSMHAVLCMALHKHTDSDADEIHSLYFSTVSQVPWVVFFIFPACISGQLQDSSSLSYTLKN